MSDMLIKLLIFFVVMVITSVTFIGTFELICCILKKINK